MQMMKLKFSIGFLLCCCALNAQMPYYVNATAYSAKEGFNVPASLAFITEDNDGLIWIGSENGLYRFNGTQFKNYRYSLKDSNSLAANNVRFIYQDKQSNYWVYIVGKGLYNYDPKTEKFYKYHYVNENEFNIHQVHSSQISIPFEDSRNRLWFPLPGYGITEIDRKANKVIPHKICFPGNCGGYRNASWITQITEDKSGRFWLATNGGLIHFDPENGKAEEIKEKEVTKQNVFNYFGPCIGEDLWVGTWGDGIKKFNTHSRTFETYWWAPRRFDGTSNICSGICLKDSTHLWVSSSESGLFIFDLVTHQFQPVQQPAKNHQNFKSFYCLKSRDNNIWISQPPSTLVKISNTDAFKSYPLKNKKRTDLTLNTATSFLKKNDKLYLGTEFSCGVCEYNVAEQSYKELFSPGAEIKNTSFIIDAAPQNGFYAGGDYGIIFYNTSENKFEPVIKDSITAKLLKQDLYCAAKDKDGSIWLGGLYKKLIHFFPATGKVLEYDLENKSYSKSYEEQINSIAIGQDDYIWFANNPFGLGCLHVPDGKVIYFNEYRNKSYPTGLCKSVCAADDGSIWFTITTDDGVWQLKRPFTDKETCINYNTSNGLPSDHIRFVFRDRNKHIWLYTSNGISQFDPVSGSCKNYSDADGINERNLFVEPYQDPEGVMYIAYDGGFQTFLPDSLIKENTVLRKIIINDFKVNNINWPLNINYLKELILQPDQKNIQFQFAALTNGNSQQLKYAYMLEAFDKGWIETGSATTGNYNNLPPGNYILKIKAGNQFSSAIPKIFSLPVTIKAYWYNTVWFKSLMVFLGFGLLYALYRYRIYTLRRETAIKFDFDKKAAELEMKALRAQMNPHFIFNCLTSINRYIVKSDNKTASNYLTKFAKLIRLILDNSAEEYISLDTEQQTLKLYMDMELLRFDHAFEYEIINDEAVAKENISIPPMLIQPYVENAIWHGLLHKDDKGKIWVRFKRNGNNSLLVEVEDNGVGRQKAKELEGNDNVKKRSYGMQISKDRIELINRLYKYKTSVNVVDLEELESKSTGTRVVLEIPMLKNNSQNS